MNSPFLENESKEFKDIINSAGLEGVVSYLSLVELDREIKKGYFKGTIHEEYYKKWAKWDEDTKIIALRRYVFYTRNAQ
jgi:hypothetical protein